MTPESRVGRRWLNNEGPGHAHDRFKPFIATESTSATLGVLMKGAPDEISRLSSFKRRRISIYRPIDGIAGDSGEALKGVPKSLGEGPLRQATPF